MKYQYPISIIMPCFNAELFISSAIKSILQQDFKDFEFIIIDDGSTDDTFDKISQFSDERIKVISLKHNQGNYAARNIGLQLAKGKYICVMDADDLSVPQRLTIQYEYMQLHPRIGCIGSYGKFINESGELLRDFRYPLSYKDIKIDLLKNNCFLHSSLMMRKSLLVKYNIQYNEKLYYSADYDFLWKCSTHFTLKNLPEVLVYYRVHSNQISRKKYTEQQQYADGVRLEQLGRFMLRLEEQEKHLYLKLMTYQQLSERQLQRSEILFNKIIEQNHQLRLYPIDRLFLFFNRIFDLAITTHKLSTIHSYRS